MKPAKKFKTRYATLGFRVFTAIPQWRIVIHALHRDPTFTKQITTLLPDDGYKELQSALTANPDAGDLIKGGGGIRKLCWGRLGGGKRGGIRTIYFWRKEQDQILMLVAYPKSRKDNLTVKEATVLRDLVKEL